MHLLHAAFCLLLAILLLFASIGFYFGAMPKWFPYHHRLPNRWREDINQALLIGLNAHMYLAAAVQLYLAKAVLEFYLDGEVASPVHLTLFVLLHMCALLFLPQTRTTHEAHALGIDTRRTQRLWLEWSAVLAIVVWSCLMYVELSRNFIVLYFPACILLLCTFWLFHRENMSILRHSYRKKESGD